MNTAKIAFTGGESKAYPCDVIGLLGVAQAMRLLKSDAGWVVVH